MKTLTTLKTLTSQIIYANIYYNNVKLFRFNNIIYSDIAELNNNINYQLTKNIINKKKEIYQYLLQVNYKPKLYVYNENILLQGDITEKHLILNKNLTLYATNIKYKNIEPEILQLLDYMILLNLKNINNNINSCSNC